MTTSAVFSKGDFSFVCQGGQAVMPEPGKVLSLVWGNDWHLHAVLFTESTNSLETFFVFE